MNSAIISPLDTLKNSFGFETFLPGQEKVIQKILQKQSALAIFPTGSGKSLCYQLPAVHFEGLTLVISPLIALMKDQVEFLTQHSIPAARLDSSISLEESKQIFTQIRKNQLKLLYIAPERLSNERFIQTLIPLKIDCMVIDEAHCISEWGHNFRPDYLKLADLVTELKIKTVLTLTATATPEVAKDICRAFHIPKKNMVHQGFYRPNLELSMITASPFEKKELLLQQIQQREQGATIVYVTLQKTAELVANFLKEQGLESKPYHAGLKSEVREEIQDWFMNSNHAVVVATIAFGMGIDKANIRYIYHYNLPKSLENYSQEVGRAGRDGKPARCELLGSTEDLIVLENFIYGDTPEATDLSACIQHIVEQEKEFDLSLYELSQNFNIRPLVLNTLLTYLELMGIIEATAPFYQNYQFQPKDSFDTIYNTFDENRVNFLRRLFNQATKAKIWYTIDIKEASETLKEKRSRLVKALNYLEEKDFLLLKVTGIRQGYRIKRSPKDLSALQEQLILRFQEREQREIQRIQTVCHLISTEACKVRYLLNYFGEKLPQDCNHCSWCHEQKTPPFERNSTAKLTKEEIVLIKQAHEQNPSVLSSSRRLAQFLCGLNFPKLNRSNLKKNEFFGAFEKTPFALVLQETKLLFQEEP